MARKSQLTDKQWHDIERRFISGESARALGREFGVAESTIRTRFSAQSAQIKAVASQVIRAEEAFKALPYSAQISAQSLIDDLRSVSLHLAGAAKYGAMTAHRLNGIANQQLDKIDDTDLTSNENMEIIRGTAIVTELANKASVIGNNLLSANKETINKANSEPEQRKQIDDKTKAAKIAGMMALAKQREQSETA